MNETEIAKKFGVTKSYISQIINGKKATMNKELVDALNSSYKLEWEEKTTISYKVIERKS